MASLGHSDTQVSQPEHFSSSTLAGIYIILSKKTDPFTAFQNLSFQQETEYYKIVAILQLFFEEIL
jgi:hypothetical protein